MCLILAGCGPGYTDGTYEAKSSLYEGDVSQNIPGCDYGNVKLRIEDGKTADCTYEMYDPNGVLKGSEYGKDSDKELYQIAQRSDLTNCNDTMIGPLGICAGGHFGDVRISKQVIFSRRWQQSEDTLL